MFAMLNFLKMRYLGEKGQGIVEYALILVFVVAIAAVLTTDSGIKAALTNAFDNVANALSSK